MRVHYYMQFFPGEGSPGSLQPFSLAMTLARRGHDVTVISADYNVDSGVPEPAVDRAVDAGRVRVFRLPCPRGGRASNGKRLVAYLSYMISALAKARALPVPDVVVGSIQPMFAGWAALRAARRAGAPFLLEIRDLWPDALVVKGALAAWQAAPLHAIVNKLYREADRIVSLTPGIRAELLRKGVPAEKVDVFPNGFNPVLFEGAEARREEIRRKYGWGNDFVAVYTGSFQQVTAVEVFVRAASRLKGAPGIRIALFGAGPTRNAVRRLAEELSATNVEFHEPVPKSEVPAILAAADVGLMALFRSPLVHIYFENKLMDYLGAGKPVFAAMDGEQARLIREAGAGRVVGTFDDEGLANALLEASRNPEELGHMGARGQELIRRSFLLPEILGRYATRIEECAVTRCRGAEAWVPA